MSIVVVQASIELRSRQRFLYVAISLLLLYISDLIGTPEEDWDKYYLGKEFTFVLYLVIGFYIYSL